MSYGVDGDPPPDIRKIGLSDFTGGPLTLDHFTGDGLQRTIAEMDSQLRVLHVHFEAGARTRPHFHKGAQILWFLEGVGEVASPDKVISCRPGEIVRIDPYVEHWHGAAGTGSTSHLAVTVGETVWEKEDGWDQHRPAENSMSNLERARYLWEEYHYRHDLIWRLLFRITFVAVLLTIIPFTINPSIRDRVDGWLTLLPILAILLTVGSWRLLVTEFQLFAPIDKLYRWYRERALKELLLYPQGDALHPQGDALRELGRKPFDFFKLIVFAYPPLLLVLIALAFTAFLVTGPHR